ncbi:sulfatase [Verrucomicrobiota bacterium]
MKSPAPNILLIITDQQSADTMSHEIGRDHIHTPAMDSIAASGLRFTGSYCAHPLCLPSRSSMFSGRYPHEIGVMTNKDHERSMTGFPCIGTIFRDAGYDTGYVGKWHFTYPIHDAAAHGFRFLSNNIGNGTDILNSEKANEFLREPRRAPFFLVVSYNNPHNICEWARGKRGSLPDGTLGDPPPLDQLPPLRANCSPQQDEPEAVSLLRRSYHASKTFPVGKFSEQDWREYRWAYYRMIECVDGHIAVLLDALDSTGLRENTAVVFTSDHGDAQGSHAWNQKTVLHDESTRVPCIVSYPQRISPGTSDALVQTGIDLAPTLCDLSGIEPSPSMPGKSMLRAAEVKGSNELDRSYVVAETRFIQGAAIDGIIPTLEGRMVRSQRYKYCVYDKGTHRESLVDMQTDPGETINLAKDRKYIPELKQHRRFLDEFSRRFADPFPRVVTTDGEPNKTAAGDT